jgi:hypothetical protein
MVVNPAADPPQKSGKKRGRPPGIKTRCAFNPSHWWTERLINHLAETAAPKGLSAAKNYARAGRVVELNVLPGVISAKVQGKRKTPYLVRIKLPVPDDEQLRNIRAALYEKAIYRSMLLSGEIPRELDRIFMSAGVSLSLEGFLRFKQMCTCSEPEETCKHVLAVLYVTAAVFDRDPFMFLKMNGLEKKTLMEFLCAPVGCGGAFFTSGAAVGNETPGRRVSPGPLEPEARLPVLDASFYGTPVLREESSGIGVSSEGNIYPVPMSEFPMWRGEVSFADSTAPYYKAVKKFFSGGERE